MEDKISYYLRESDNTLIIHKGSTILAEIEDGKAEESFVEDILYGMGYIWNLDGTITERKNDL